MKLARALLRAVDRELGFIKARGGSNVHVDAAHEGPGALVATVNSSLDGEVEIRKFVCFERHSGRTPTKREVWSKPETTIIVREVA